ncbi:MAG: riboflavin synthase [Candidatus Eisenbacteria bacterium]|nr:riboflavin synthase [Candidatus Eisenbacteria bacterium]
MFTGLVEERGTILAVEARPAGRRLWIGARTALDGTAAGDSVAVSGCCLTVVEIRADRFAADVVPETLARTTLGGWSAGDPVNLERSLRLDQRLGGHLVQGHVDGVGTVRHVTPEGEGRRVALDVPSALARFVAEKGSIAVDGMSLTVAAVTPAGCEIALIPHTLAVTVAADYAPGRAVNLEVDLLARYLDRLLAERAPREPRPVAGGAA